jgi:pimeloyl-ACP methyl ester carboxylesterase
LRADHLRIPVGPASLHVERFGHGGVPIVLLHGFGTCSFLWRDVAPELAAGRHTAFAVDLLGYGESDRPLEGDFGVAAQAEYLDRCLTALRVARAVIVGVDVGGGVAMRLAATRPDRVSGLVLVNTVAFDELPGRDVRTLQRNTARFAFRITRGMFGATPLLAPVLQGSVADPTRMPDRLVARYLAPFVGRDGVGHLLALARSLRSEEVDELDLGSIVAPTLVVHGEADRWTEPTLPTRLVRAIPGSTLVRFAGVGRLVPEEAPVELARAVLEFVATLPPPPTPPPARSPLVFLPDLDAAGWGEPPALGGTTGDTTGDAPPRMGARDASESRGPARGSDEAAPGSDGGVESRRR